MELHLFGSQLLMEYPKAKGLGLCATFLVSDAWSALNSEYERINTSLNIPRSAGRGRYFTPVNHHHHNKVSKRASYYHYLSLRQTFVSKCVVSCFSQAFPATSVNENAKYDQEGCTANSTTSDPANIGRLLLT